MRIVLCLLLTLPLNGCLFFFYIPGSVMDKLAGGNACASDGSHVGQYLKHDDGRTGTIAKVYGASSRCQGRYPVLVDVNFDGAK